VSAGRGPVGGRAVALGMFATLALGGVHVARAAGTCAVSIEANDIMQYNARMLQVDGDCESVELTLRHVGKQDAHVIGHDWVLARSGDVAALSNAGMAAGFDKGYLPANDPRILAATKVVGGGEAVTIHFSTSGLAQGGDYSFFCSYPGHSALMRGRFKFGDKDKVASNH
jgi:azurin